MNKKIVVEIVSIAGFLVGAILVGAILVGAILVGAILVVHSLCGIDNSKKIVTSNDTLFVTQNKDEYTADSVLVNLNFSDIDTVYFFFPTSISVSDYFEVQFDYADNSNTNLFKVCYFPLNSVTSNLSKNDSTFILGTASTWANFISDSSYSVFSLAEKGIGFVIARHGADNNNTILFKICLRAYAYYPDSMLYNE